MTDRSGSSRTGIIVLYLVLLAGFFAASFFTDIRIWGISTWGYFPLWGRLVLLGIGLACIPLALKVGRDELSDSRATTRTWVLATIGAAVVAGVCFWVFRGQTHFLGDGYVNLALLAAKAPYVVNRDFGEMQAHLQLASMLGGNNKENVLLSYQILSVTAGILFLVLVAWTARRLFERSRDAVLFTLLVMLSGQVLLFFGYVENYSLFVLSVGGFTCFGLLSARGMLPRWTILIPLICAIGCHIFGLILLVPAAYLLLAGGRIERRFAESSFALKVVMILASVALAATGLWLATDYSMFLRVSLLSFTETRFTVQGYTLVSPDHLADLGNFLLLLIPGLPLLLIGLWQAPLKSLSAGTDYRFLIVLSITALIPVLIFDPKLGMPRDWDLFSYAAVPLAVFLAYALLSSRSKLPHSRMILAFAVALAALTAAARVGTQWVPTMALRQVEDYVNLDQIKGKQAMVLIQTYYSEIRDREGFEKWGKRYLSYPDEQLLSRADSLIKRNRLSEAYDCLMLALRYNPMNPTPYKSMSGIYLRMGREAAARAVIDTGLGLRPGNPDLLVGKGFFLQRDGKLADAERTYIQATEIAPQKSLAWFYLARLRLTMGDSAQYIQYLDTASTREDAAPELYLELCGGYASLGRYQQAAGALRKGIEKGLSRQAVDDMVRRYPELQRYRGR